MLKRFSFILFMQGLRSFILSGAALSWRMWTPSCRRFCLFNSKHSTALSFPQFDPGSTHSAYVKLLLIVTRCAAIDWLLTKTQSHTLTEHSSDNERRNKAVTLRSADFTHPVSLYWHVEFHWPGPALIHKDSDCSWGVSFRSHPTACRGMWRCGFCRANSSEVGQPVQGRSGRGLRSSSFWPPFHCHGTICWGSETASWDWQTMDMRRNCRRSWNKRHFRLPYSHDDFKHAKNLCSMGPAQLDRRPTATSCWDLPAIVGPLSRRRGFLPPKNRYFGRNLGEVFRTRIEKAISGMASPRLPSKFSSKKVSTRAESSESDADRGLWHARHHFGPSCSSQNHRQQRLLQAFPPTKPSSSFEKEETKSCSSSSEKSWFFSLSPSSSSSDMTLSSDYEFYCW